MQILKKIHSSLKVRGFWNTITLIILRFFLKFKFRKFDFWGQVETDEMNVPDEVRIHANSYQASNLVYFKSLFQDLDWQFKESSFIDFGCGKGATLVFASNLGFKKVIGVEFSPELAQTAIVNMQKFSDQHRGKINFEITIIDASQYEIPSSADCFYFFNPFDGFILDKVLQNILKSLEKYPRKILIVYLNALHNAVVEKYKFRKIKYIPREELDNYYSGGAYVYTND